MRLEAEKRLIGTVMHHGADGLSIAVDVGCVAGAFYDERHQAIWGLMVELDKAGAPLSMVSVCQAAMQNGVGRFGGLAYVSSLPDSVAAVEAIPYWVGIVLEARARRDAELIAMQLVEACRSGAPLGEARADALDKLDKLEGEGEAGRKVVDGAAMADLLWDAVTTDGAQPPSLGCSVMDAVFGPALVPKRFSLIGARPGTGKTALALNVCSSILFGGGGVLFCSLEQPAQQIAVRMCAIDGAESFGKLDNRPRGADPRAWHGARWDAIQEHREQVYGFGVRWQVDDKPGPGLAYIRARAMRAQRSMAAAGHRLRLVVIDYVQLCSLARKGDQNTAEALGDLANGLAGMAKQLDVAVLCLSQLNRDSEKANRPPRSSDLKASGGLEEAADVILLCHRPGNRPGHADVKMNVNRTKNRHGKCRGWDLSWEGEFLRVSGESQGGW